MLASLATGTSRIRGLATGADVAATARALRRLGVELPDGVSADELVVDGPARFVSPDAAIDCGNSGTTARILAGLIAGLPISATLDGDESLRRRPMDRVIEPLRRSGARLQGLEDPSRLPIKIDGGGLGPIEHRSEVASAQVKSALLLAGLTGGVPVRVVQPARSRDHTERLLRAMGVRVEESAGETDYEVRLEAPGAPLRPIEARIPGDLSSAAFWIALAVLGGCGPGLRVEGVGLNPTRTGFVRILEAMGARLEVKVLGEEAGEPVGVINARPGPLRGFELPPEWILDAIDEVPMLACLAARARGRTVVAGAAELRVKESDRITTTCSNLKALGVTCRERRDGLEIWGRDAGLSGSVTSAGDHRIAMAFGVLGALAGNDIRIDDTRCVDVSYPGFWEELAAVATATNEAT